MDRSSTTTTSVFPRTWRVGVEYEGVKIFSQISPPGLYPEIAMQNSLRNEISIRYLTGITERTVVDGGVPHQRGMEDINEVVLAVHVVSDNVTFRYKYARCTRAAITAANAAP
jgi:hypothetical protein